MMQNRAVHGRDAHLVAVIFDAANHASLDTLRMQHAFRHTLTLERPETQDIRVRNWSRTHSKDVTHHTTDPSVRSTERLECTRMVVRFNLDRNVKFVVEFDDARVVNERRTHPGFVDLVRGCHQVRFQHALNARAVRGGNHGPERLVNAVFAPSLRDHLEFNVARISRFGNVISANRLHLREVQGEPSFTRNLEQARIIGITNRNHFHLIASVGDFRNHKRSRDARVEGEALHDGIGKFFTREFGQRLETKFLERLNSFTRSGLFKRLNLEQLRNTR